jgi:hypothetical protein
MRRWVAFPVLLFVLVSDELRADSSKSAAAAADLVAALDQRKLDVISTRLPGQQDRYVAAMRLAGTGLMVIEGRYTVPVLINERIWRGDHREAYVMLNSASPSEGRRFIQDLGTPGLHEIPASGQPFDLLYDSGALWLKLDGDWAGQKLSREEYSKRFAEADERYAASLAALKDALASAETSAQPR